MENILKIDKIEKYYGNKSSLTKAIDNLSFDVEKGEFVAIMGASGSGKTTLLNCISTIDKVTSGHIYVAGNDGVSCNCLFGSQASSQHTCGHIPAFIRSYGDKQVCTCYSRFFQS